MAVMEPNNFEKKIQQKLGELKIPPSDAVWENVEKHIAKKKDRRRAFIFLLLFLFLLSGGYWILNSRENQLNQQNKQVSKDLKKDSKRTKKEDSSLNQTARLSTASTKENNGTGAISKNRKTQAQDIENNKTQKKSQESVIKKRSKSKISATNENTASKGTSISIKPTKPAASEANSLERDLAIHNPNDSSEKKLKQEDIPDDDVSEKSNQPDSVSVAQNKKLTRELSKNSAKNLSKATDSSINKISKSRQTHKWKLGITFSGGTSALGGSTVGTNNPGSFARMDFISIAPSNYMLSTNNYFTPSPIKNSVALIGGIFVEKNISRKTKIDLGISYKYYSLINTTGNKIDFNIDPSLSARSVYSSWSDRNTQRNNFHYLEIPVSLKFQLGKSKTLPLYWLAGVTVSQLISSNALQFKSSPGLYYNDNSLFNKTQIGLQTGFSAVLFSRTKNPLSIGPYFIYNASKLANKGLYDGKHFSFIGIKTELLLGKK
jgi:hypothetical protein